MSGPKKPLVLMPYPKLRPVAPYPFQKLSLPECEHDLFDSVAQEHVQVLGTEIDYYPQDISAGTRDPLYDEPTKRVFLGPYRFKGYASWANSTPEARQEGVRSTFQGEIWVARKEIEEARLPAPPSESDVLRIWRGPFFDGFGVDFDGSPNAGYFFDIVDVDDDGHIFDSASFVGFKLTVKRRTEFTPERRVTNT